MGIPLGTEELEYDLRPRFPKVTITIILINIAMYVISTYRHKFVSISEDWLEFGSFIPLLIAQDPIKSSYRFFTSMFLHADLLHIFFNMYFLYFFGKAIENTLGGKRFLALYFLSGLSASLFHTAFSYLQGLETLGIPAIGASGAISGVLGAYFIFYPGTYLTVCWFLYIPICFTWPAVAYLLLWFLLQVLYGYLRLGLGVAVFAHAGGFIAGIVFSYILANRQRLLKIKMRRYVGSLFRLIYFKAPVRRGGLGVLTKTILSLVLVIMALTLIAGFIELYPVKKIDMVIYSFSGSYTICSAKTGRIIKSETFEFPIAFRVDLEQGILHKPALRYTDELNVLMNRLLFSRLLFNPSMANKIIRYDYKYIEVNLVLQCGIVKVPLILKNFVAVYDRYGLAKYISGLLRTRSVLLVSPTKCYVYNATWYDYNITIRSMVGEGAVDVKDFMQYSMSLATAIVLYAAYVVVARDKELVLV